MNPAGDAIGIAGVMYPVATRAEQQRHFQELWPVVKYIDHHFTEPIMMSEMAAMADLSSTQFNARFKAIMRRSPSQYLTSRRINHAQQLLTQTDASIPEIAVGVGFFDQSHFTKRFRRITGLTPLNYRKRFR